MLRQQSGRLFWVLFGLLFFTTMAQASLTPVRGDQLLAFSGEDGKESQVSDPLYMELIEILNKVSAARNKATQLNLAGGASCSRLLSALEQIKSTTSDLQRQLWAGHNCPPQTEDIFTVIGKSPIFKDAQPNPLSFLSSRLSQFTKATRIFTTRDYTHTNVAAEFHKACDNVPNVLVIIKSGQYIAGGFAAVSFESWDSYAYKPDPSGNTFLFSSNRQKLYLLQEKSEALLCNKEFGPMFGRNGILVMDDYARLESWADIHMSSSSFYDDRIVLGELFGARTFKIDEYQVWKLE